MSVNLPALPPLIADSDQLFTRSLRMDQTAKTLPPVVTFSKEDTLRAIARPDAAYSAIFVNPKIDAPLAIPVIRTALKHCPTVPIFFLSDGATPELTAHELDQLTVRKVIAKPASYGDLLRAIKNLNHTLDVDVLKQSMDGLNSGAEVQGDGKDQAFVPIRAEQFLSGSTSLFDVYVRLRQDHFVKILTAGDPFDVERVNQYLARGVTHFYLRKSAQERYLQYCDRLSSMVLRKQGVPDSVKVNFVLNQGEETRQFLQAHGATEAGLQYAAHFVEKTRTLIDKLQAGGDPQLRQYLKDVLSFEHGVATAMVAALIVKTLGFHTAKNIVAIGLAAFLHDIGLQDLPEKFRQEDEQALTPEEIFLYRQHPIKSAEILAGIPGIDSSVIQAVRQHHERRDRSGFPDGLGAGSINRVAEIVGISDEFVRIFHRAKLDPRIDPHFELELYVFPKFSGWAVEGLKKALPHY